jgi:hypothetical protein
MRYSKAVYTSTQTVITINRAMTRSGFLRESDEAKNCGSLRIRTLPAGVSEHLRAPPQDSVESE